MFFCGKTKSGNKHLYPKWWVFFFGGTYKQDNGGYGWCPSMISRVRRFYRETWHEQYSLWEWIWDQSPYYSNRGLVSNFNKTECTHPILRLSASTCAKKSTFLNVNAGVTIHCDNCGRKWTGDLNVGCPEAWGDGYEWPESSLGTTDGR